MYFIHLMVVLFQIYVLWKYGLSKSLLVGLYILFFSFLVILGSFYVYHPETSPYILSQNYSSTMFATVLLLHQILLLIIWLSIPGKIVLTPAIRLDLRSPTVKRYVIILLALIVIIVGLDIFRNGLPIFYKILGQGASSSDIVKFRSEYFESNGSFWLNAIGYYTVPSLLTIILLISYRRAPSRLKLLVLLTMIVLSVLLSLSFAHKTPLVTYVIGIYFIYSLTLANAPILSRRVVLIFLMLFGLIVGQYAIVYSNQDIYSYWDIFNGIINRIIGAYPLGLAVAIDLQDSTGLLWGQTFPNVLGLHPNSFNLSTAIHYELFNIEGYAPAPFIGYAYINFGLFGVFIGTITSLIFLRGLDLYIARIKNVYLKSCLYALFFQKVLYMPMSSLFENLLNPRDIFLYVILLTIVYLKINGKKSSYLQRH